MKTNSLTKTFALTLSLALVPLTLLAKDITRSRTIQEFFKENTHLRVSKKSVETYKTTLNEMSLKVIQRATTLAEKAKRQTILKEDLIQAADDVFRRSPISVSELKEKIDLLSNIELSKLANQIKAKRDDLLENKE